MEIRYKVMDNQFDFRLNMVRYSQEFSVSEAARVFGRTRKTVRKWRDRFNKEGLSGLTDRSRRPHYSPNKTSQRDRDKIIHYTCDDITKLELIQHHVSWVKK